MGALREVNLELGLPTVEQAMRRLTAEIPSSRKLGCTVLKIIHGYGSTGTGGKIRTAARRNLASMKSRRVIRDFIPGEKFSIFEPCTLSAFSICDALRRDSDLERYNNGVTFILL